MKKISKHQITRIIQAALALILALTPFVLKPVCKMLMKNGQPMPCYHSGILLTAIGVVLLGLYLVAYYLGRPKFDLVANIVALFLIAMAYLLPSRKISINFLGLNQCGLCKSPEMSCQQSFHWISILLGLLFVLSLAAIVMSLVLKEEAA